MNKFCVYLHRSIKDNKVFYVGEGTLARSTSKSSRNPKWHEASSSGWYVQVVKQNLSKKESLDLEEKLIKIYPSLTNSLTSNKKTLALNINLFKELFAVSSDSQTGLVWNKSNNTNSPMNRKNVGDQAGRLTKRKCGKPAGWQVSFFGRSYSVHRIVWLLEKGTLNDDLVIDHIDRNPLNNNISNLREVNYSTNARNCSTRSDNVSGYKGISLVTMGNTKYYSATWYENDKQITKNFSIKKHGELAAFNLALELRKEKEINYD